MNERTVGFPVSRYSFHNQGFLSFSFKFYLVSSWQGVRLQGQRGRDEEMSGIKMHDPQRIDTKLILKNKNPKQRNSTWQKHLEEEGFLAHSTRLCPITERKSRQRGLKADSRIASTVKSR